MNERIIIRRKTNKEINKQSNKNANDEVKRIA